MARHPSANSACRESIGDVRTGLQGVVIIASKIDSNQYLLSNIARPLDEPCSILYRLKGVSMGDRVVDRNPRVHCTLRILIEGCSRSVKP